MLSITCVSVTIASHFQIVDKNSIKELKDKGQNENTKNSMECWKYAFKKQPNERNFQVNYLEEYESNVLDQALSKFNAFGNSVILPSMLFTSSHNGSS